MKDKKRQFPIQQSANPWSRIKREIRYENDWIRLFHDDVIRPDGTPGVYGVVHYRNRSVGIVAIDELRRVLLVGQYRYTIGKYSWEIPAGGCLESEEPIQSAHRELKEETGYTAQSMKCILHAHMSNSISDEEGYLFLAQGLRGGFSCPESSEVIQWVWDDLQAVLERISAGEITDALTILGIQQAALPPTAKMFQEHACRTET